MIPSLLILYEKIELLITIGPKRSWVLSIGTPFCRVGTRLDKKDPAVIFTIFLN